MIPAFNQAELIFNNTAQIQFPSVRPSTSKNFGKKNIRNIMDNIESYVQDAYTKKVKKVSKDALKLALKSINGEAKKQKIKRKPPQPPTLVS